MSNNSIDSGIKKIIEIPDEEIVKILLKQSLEEDRVMKEQSLLYKGSSSSDVQFENNCIMSRAIIIFLKKLLDRIENGEW